MYVWILFCVLSEETALILVQVLESSKRTMKLINLEVCPPAPWHGSHRWRYFSCTWEYVPLLLGPKCYIDTNPEPFVRNTLRQLRSAPGALGRHVSPRLWSDDGISFYRILPVDPVAGSLQPSRRKRHLQRQRQLCQHLVCQTPGFRSGPRGRWIGSGRRYLPDHDIAADSSGRISVDDEDLCVPDSVPALHL